MWEGKGVDQEGIITAKMVSERAGKRNIETVTSRHNPRTRKQHKARRETADRERERDRQRFWRETS